jgi:hypothetical protein
LVWTVEGSSENRRTLGGSSMGITLVRVVPEYTTTTRLKSMYFGVRFYMCSRTISPTVSDLSVLYPRKHIPIARRWSQIHLQL